MFGDGFRLPEGEMRDFKGLLTGIYVTPVLATVDFPAQSERS